MCIDDASFDGMFPLVQPIPVPKTLPELIQCVWRKRICSELKRTKAKTTQLNLSQISSKSSPKTLNYMFTIHNLNFQ